MLWFRLPLVPWIVKVYVPAGVLCEVVTVIVDDPEPVTVDGLKLALARDGNPVALNVTVPLKPLIAATVAVYVVLDPREIVREAGVAEIEKSGGLVEVTTSVTVVL